MPTLAERLESLLIDCRLDGEHTCGRGFRKGQADIAMDYDSDPTLLDNEFNAPSGSILTSSLESTVEETTSLFSIVMGGGQPNDIYAINQTFPPADMGKLRDAWRNELPTDTINLDSVWDGLDNPSLKRLFPIYTPDYSTGVKSVAPPIEHRLNNYPNPFSSSTKITLDGKSYNSRTHMIICDVAGREITTLDRIMAYNDPTFAWNGKTKDGNIVPSEIYFATIMGEDGRAHTKKLNFVK